VIKGEDTMPQLVAVLDTNFWLWTHVTVINMGYAGALLTSAIAHIFIVGRVVGARSRDPDFYASLSRILYGTLGFGLIFTVVGTILGGIWANESWGRFWGWDPKENGALMIVLAQLAILHGRLGGILKSFGIAMAAVGMGVIVAFSWWGVNLLGIGLHSYGWASGVALGLYVFYALEATVLLAGGLWWYLRRRARAHA
jgi:ABC-type transport system involved in cytochrome c biogenesis permease subunit